MCQNCQGAMAIKLLLRCMLLTSEDFFLTLYWAHWFRPKHFQALHRGPDLISTRNQVSAEEIYDVILRTHDAGDPVACSCARSYTSWNWLQNHNNTAVVLLILVDVSLFRRQFKLPLVAILDCPVLPNTRFGWFFYSSN